MCVACSSLSSKDNDEQVTHLNSFAAPAQISQEYTTFKLINSEDLQSSIKQTKQNVIGNKLSKKLQKQVSSSFMHSFSYPFSFGEARWGSSPRRTRNTSQFFHEGLEIPQFSDSSAGSTLKWNGPRSEVQSHHLVLGQPLAAFLLG